MIIIRFELKKKNIKFIVIIEFATLQNLESALGSTCQVLLQAEVTMVPD